MLGCPAGGCPVNPRGQRGASSAIAAIDLIELLVRSRRQCFPWTCVEGDQEGSEEQGQAEEEIDFERRIRDTAAKGVSVSQFVSASVRR